MKKFLNNYILPYLLFAVFKTWCLTLSVRQQNPDGEKYLRAIKGKFVLTLWHGRIFYLFYHCRNITDFHLLISPSLDGDILARLGQLVGYSVIRGSSFKNAVPSARSLIKVLKREGRVAIIADGSRGPCRQVQPGLLQIAGITGAPVIPISFDASRKWVFNSWDQFVLPVPFTRCTVNTGTPLVVLRRLEDGPLQEKQLELENILNQLTLESG
ncbi:hypothetical protein MNBD_NITROSPINAE05-1256 [hydrothermal vent metagenome]|uniref:DUF374 domain-containing protein n=1 Tax=hydrothermal vent metagenome TaxID=652676 RepID=A0A3B1D646_9ZZZZ